MVATAYMFPGQGCHHRGMGGDLFDRFDQVAEEASEVLGYSIRDLCLQDPDRRLHNTEFTQPAIYVVNELCRLAKVQDGELAPDCLVGHSLGEYNALVAAGALTFLDGLRLVHRRGELMAQVKGGAMAAILNFPPDEIRDRLDSAGLIGVDIANLNCSTQTVISGQEEDLGLAAPLFGDGDTTFVPLNTSGAFHSRYMEPLRAGFEVALRNCPFAPTQHPVYANYDAKPYGTDRSTMENLSYQLTHSVRFSECIARMLDHGVETFVEVGTGDTLTKLVERIRDDWRSNCLQSVDRTNKLPYAGHAQMQTRLRDPAAQIEHWNREVPVGTRVLCADGVQRVTRTEARVLFGVRAVVYVDGCAGYFALDTLSPARGSDSGQRQETGLV